MTRRNHALDDGRHPALASMRPRGLPADDVIHPSPASSAWMSHASMRPRGLPADDPLPLGQIKHEVFEIDASMRPRGLPADDFMHSRRGYEFSSRTRFNEAAGTTRG